MTQAARASGFIGSLGVNTHLDFNAYGYQNLPVVEEAINYLGVKNLRDSAAVMSDLAVWQQVTGATGAKFDDFIGETSQSGMSAYLNLMPQLADEGILNFIEGGNEEDDSYPQSLGNTLQYTAQFQQQVYALGQQLHLPVINISFGAGWSAANNWQGDYDNVGDLSAYSDYANAHTYPGIGQATDWAMQRLNGLAQLAASARPVITTEIGWDLAQSYTQQQVAKYALDAALDGMKDHDVKTYFYALFNDGSGQFGLMNQDGTPTPAGAAIHDLTMLLVDAGSDAGTFTPGSLDYTLSGAQDGDNTLLLQKSDGSYWLFLWNEGEAAGTPHQVTVTLSSVAAVKTFDPLSGIAPTSDQAGRASVIVSVPDHHVLVEIIPASLSVPTAPAVTPDGSPVPTPYSPASPLPGAGSSDELSVQGTHTQYDIIIDSNVGDAVVQDKVAGREGTKTLQNLHEVIFADGIAVLDPTGNGEEVARFYSAALGRAPDATGLNFWTAQLDNHTLNIDAVALGFINSAEFQGKYGTLDNIQFVAQLYQNVLHRAPDPSGEQYWIGQLNSGTSRAAVLVGFSDSLENKINTQGAIGDPNMDEAYRLYQAAFNRTPDMAGLSYWTDQLDSGTTPLQMAQGFANSSEFSRLFAGVDATGLVDQMYQNVLHRTPDAAGAQYWSGQLNQGTSLAQVLLGFSDSLENRLNTSQATHDGWVYLANATV